MSRAGSLALIVVCNALLGCAKVPPEVEEPLDLCNDSLRDTGDVLTLQTNRDVDILFVIDNSASMAAAQAKLAGSVAALVDALDEAGANYRFGVTTTDNGNLWCPTTTPERGELVASSCTTRLDDFVLGGGLIDARELACNDVCTLDAADLEILPTTTDRDPTAAPRPWIEHNEGLTNLPPGTDFAQALACLLPQGIAGCPFTQPLESMYLALARATAVEQASSGFIRRESVLVVVFLTDGVDCSHGADAAEIFAADGSKTFWADPDAEAPTTALCWNAGVACIGDPSGYESCDPVNKDLDGKGEVSDPMAVLRPMSRYLGLVRGIRDEKQALNAGRQVIVALIGGVSGNGEDWSVSYVDVSESDPGVHQVYGIGPGCTADDGTIAAPPVRVRDLSEAFVADTMYSICAADFRPGLEDLAGRIREQFWPGCYSKCVHDQDPSTAVVDPECTVWESLPANVPSSEVRECARTPEGHYAIDPQTGRHVMPADDVDTCYVALVDPDGSHTPDPHDDMSPECVERNFNLEFVIAHRFGVPAPGATAYWADCTLADCPADDCPGIGG
jgi:hypothetical protein